MKSGWKVRKFGDACDLKKGKKPALSIAPANGAKPYLVARYLRGSDPAEFAFISDRNSIMVDQHEIIIICDGSNSGETFIGFDGILSSTMAKISHGPDIDNKFLMHYLASLFEKFNAAKTGAAIPHLDLVALREQDLPIPPFHEQQRIVGILDEAFEGIATAKTNAEKNLQNARALFESHLQSVFIQRGAGWDRVTLETLLERGWIESHLDGNHGGDYPRKEEFINEGVPYISANCLSDEHVDMSRAKYLSPDRAALLRKGIAKDRDVLFAHNATVGPVAVLRTDEEKVILGTSLTYYRCNLAYILPEYLAHYMRSFGFKSQYLQVMRQSTRNQIPITKQRDFFHVIPPLDEQKMIIGQLDGLFESGWQLANIYQRKLAALEALKKSLLNQAFTGEL